MDKVINFKLLAHPINWVIVLVMLVMAGVAGHFMMLLIHKEPATATGMMQAGAQERVANARGVLG